VLVGTLRTVTYISISGGLLAESVALPLEYSAARTAEIT
jgi:hypothetical protein